MGSVARALAALFCSKISFSGTGRRPQLVEPVVVRLHELDRDVRVEVIRRHDVEHRQVCDLVRVIERQALADAPAAVVADNGEARVAVVLHHLDHVERHRALRVVRVIFRVLGLAAVAVAAQVRHDDRVVFREVGRDLVPGHVRLRRAVDQEQRRTVAALDDVDGGARGLDLLVLEAGRKEPERVGFRLSGGVARSGRGGSSGDGGQGGSLLQQLTPIEVSGMGHAADSSALPLQRAVLLRPPAPGQRTKLKANQSMNMIVPTQTMACHRPAHGL